MEAGTNLLLFFTLPFVALLATVARASFPPWAPRGLATAAIALATLFAAVGLWQAATHELFFYAPNLAASNANTDYFRVTSLFGDPSLYGRHVVLGIGVALTLLATRRWHPWPLIGLVAVMWAGLLFSYSQSSMVALLVITVVLAVATGDRRVRRAVALLTLAAALVGCGYLAVQVAGGESLNRITSDRTNRVEDAVRVIEKHPVVGVGIGGQPRASRRLAGSQRPTPNFVSHTTPLTVFAELGAIGLVLYAWLLVGGAWLILQVRRVDEPLGLALGVAFIGLFVHALFYSGFLEDPLTWLVIGIAAAYCVQPARSSRREPARGVVAHGGAVRAGGDHAAGARVGSHGTSARRASTRRVRSRRWSARPARSGTWASRVPRPSRPRSCAAPSRPTCWRGARRRSRAGPASPSSWRSGFCSWRPPPCSSSACATPPRRGSSRTTPPTRPSSAASWCSTSTTPTGTTTASRGWSASTPATAACPSACATARWRSSTSPTSPARWSPRRCGGCCPSPSTTTGCSCCSPRWRCCRPRCCSAVRSNGGSLLGAVLVCNPIAVRSAWFGQNDAPSLLLLVLAFALVTRRRFAWAAAAIAGAILLKQFAIVALPFLVLMVPREEWKRAGLVFAGVLAAGILPFLVADPVAFYDDTVKYGAGTYKIVGYGLSAILVRLGIIEDRDGSYPFALLALLTWVPLTVWLVLVQRRAQELWVGAAAFSISILWLMFIGRTFNNYYLVWPMTGAIVAALLAFSVTQRAGASVDPASGSP